MLVSFQTLSTQQLSSSDIEDDALCLFAESGVDDRSSLSLWRDLATSTPARCVAVTNQHSDKIELKTGDSNAVLSLRDEEGMKQLLRGANVAYLDISGLSHHVWAPLVKIGLSTVGVLRVVYAEPVQYKFHSSPASDSKFDLSEKIGGLAPIPGFAKLRGPSDETESLFIPLLGFEGMRASQLGLNLDPLPRTVPIVGVPGFQAEHPTYTISCNREFLEDTRSFPDIRLARANCPFDAVRCLTEIHKDNPDKYLYIAPVGTKPHALGAVLFAIEHSKISELMYDHPVRRKDRSRGIGMIHVYTLRER